MFHYLFVAQAEQNEAMKAELEGIVTGLQGYLQHVQKRASKQKNDYEQLLQDREALRHRLQEMQDSYGDYRELEKVNIHNRE